MKYSDLFQKYSPELLHNEPSFWKEFKGEFISFDKDKEKLSTRFPVDDRYFNPLNILLGGIMDCYMDATMGPLTVLLGEREVTKSFHAKYIRSINSLDSFVEAKKFFWTIRCYLHILSERPNEQLNFEYQSPIAKKFPGLEIQGPILLFEINSFNVSKLIFSIFFKVSKLIVSESKSFISEERSLIFPLLSNAAGISFP